MAYTKHAEFMEYLRTHRHAPKSVDLRNPRTFNDTIALIEIWDDYRVTKKMKDDGILERIEKLEEELELKETYVKEMEVDVGRLTNGAMQYHADAEEWEAEEKKLKTEIKSLKTKLTNANKKLKEMEQADGKQEKQTESETTVQGATARTEGEVSPE